MRGWDEVGLIVGAFMKRAAQKHPHSTWIIAIKAGLHKG
jgi:hypothetical protein